MENTTITCPECGGVLMRERKNPGEPEYICQIGHRYSPEGLHANHNDRVEAALWKAYRMLNERSDVLRGLAVELEGRHPEEARRYGKLAEETRAVAESLKAVIDRALEVLAKDHEILP